MARIFRNHLIPNAVLWFTGETVSEDDDEEEDDEEEEDEEDEEVSWGGDIQVAPALSHPRQMDDSYTIRNFRGRTLASCVAVLVPRGMTIERRIPTMLERSTLGFHQRGRYGAGRRGGGGCCLPLLGFAENIYHVGNLCWELPTPHPRIPLFCRYRLNIHRYRFSRNRVTCCAPYQFSCCVP